MSIGLLLALVCAAGLLLLALPRLTRFPGQAYLVVIAAVPIWFAFPLPAIGAVYPGTIVALIGLAWWLWNAPLGNRASVIGFTAVLGAAFVILVVVGYAAGGGTSSVATPLVYWAVPLALGVVVGRRERVAMLRTLVIAGEALSVAAVVEVVTNTPIARLIPVLNAGSASLADIQYRNGLLRAEVTWGHGIALSGVLAAAALAALDTFRGWHRALAMSLCCVGLLLTGSRTGMVCLGLVALLVVARAATVGALSYFWLPIVLIVEVVLYLLVTITAASELTDDYTVSSQYRANLIAAALQHANLLGPASGFGVDVGGVFFRQFRFLDNSIIQTLVSAGWLPTAALVLVFGSIIVRFVKNPNDPWRAVCLVQIPTLLTAGFFTQHQSFFWLVVGIGAAAATTQGCTAQDQRLQNWAVGPRLNSDRVQTLHALPSDSAPRNKILPGQRPTLGTH